MVLAFATALCGGMTRDVLIGASPPQALRDWRYAVTAFIGGAIAFIGYSLIRRIPPLVILDLDAAGLIRMPALIAVLMGGITAVGGGTHPRHAVDPCSGGIARRCLRDGRPGGFRGDGGGAPFRIVTDIVGGDRRLDLLWAARRGDPAPLELTESYRISLVTAARRTESGASADRDRRDFRHARSTSLAIRRPLLRCAKRWMSSTG
jgi:Glycine transporter